MGLNFRKSISLGKLLKVNVGKSSASISAGVKGFHYSVSTTGKRRATIGIPGTGLSYTKTFGGKSDSKKSDKAKQKEIKNNKQAAEAYEEEVAEVIGIHRDGIEPINWEKNVPKELAQYKEGVLAGDIDTYYSVIETIAPFDCLVDFGSEFEIGTDTPDLMMAEFNIKADEVIPTTKVEVLASGKLSEKELTKTAYYDIYQDYVCSVTIRLARDLFAMLPIDKVIVHAVNAETNPATGNDEEVTYLSVVFDRATFDSLNLDKIDPSDSLTNFKYNMKFAKTTGFKPVDKITEW